MTKIRTIEERWEQGIEHRPESVELFDSIRKLDEKYGGDFFCFKAGGDGDNGEHLMYLLDIHFDLKDTTPRCPICEKLCRLVDEGDKGFVYHICDDCQWSDDL